jgi:hypothetical protein
MSVSEFYGPEQPLSEPIAEGVPTEAFRVRRNAAGDGEAILCTRCGLSFDRKTKLDAAVEHYRGHMAPPREPVESLVEVSAPSGPAAPSPAVERAKVERHKQEGRMSNRRDSKNFVWFTFGLPESEWKKVKSADLGGESIRPFIRQQWEAAVKADKFPQSPTTEKLKKEGFWISEPMAKDILRRESEGKFNFDYWLIAMFNHYLSHHKK